MKVRPSAAELKFEVVTKQRHVIISQGESSLMNFEFNPGQETLLT
jgi:hypothetical protein